MGKTPNAVKIGIKVFAKLSSFRQFFERKKCSKNIKKNRGVFCASDANMTDRI